ncbi:MAG TPA: hypothetical protein VK993_00495 [Chthoniobacterales bacterium]|nr:hypothetical protein [Chthoniobacterales bacterium]
MLVPCGDFQIAPHYRKPTVRLDTFAVCPYGTHRKELHVKAQVTIEYCTV